MTKGIQNVQPPPLACTAKAGEYASYMVCAEVCEASKVRGELLLPHSEKYTETAPAPSSINSIPASNAWPKGMLVKAYPSV